MITKDFTGGELDTLIALIERGPLEDGEVPSKVGRDTLIALGFAIKTVVKGQEGYQVVTSRGVQAYKDYLNCESLSEAIAKRKEQGTRIRYEEDATSS